MKKYRFLMPIVFLLITAGAGAAVMLLWNWLMPVVFGLVAINFWQALGLFVLGRILFGRLGMSRRGMMMAGMGENPIHKKWRGMSAEQRKRFIDRRRKFGFGHPFGGDFFAAEEQQSGKGDE